MSSENCFDKDNFVNLSRPGNAHIKDQARFVAIRTSGANNEELAATQSHYLAPFPKGRKIKTNKTKNMYHIKTYLMRQTHIRKPFQIILIAFVCISIVLGSMQAVEILTPKLLDLPRVLLGHNVSAVEGISYIPSPDTLEARRFAALSIEGKICYIFGHNDCPLALAISQAENGTRECDRIGITGDIGIFQINPIHIPEADNMGLNLYDCVDNIRFAKHKYDQRGWSPWVAYNNGSYKKFLR